MKEFDIVSAIERTNKSCMENENDTLYYAEVIDETSNELQSNMDCVTIITVTGLTEVMFDGNVCILSANNVLLLKNGTLTFVRSMEEGSKVCAVHIMPQVLDDYTKTQMLDCPIFYDFLRLQPQRIEYLLFDITFETVVKMYLDIVFYEVTQTMMDQVTYSKNVRSALVLFLTNLHYNYQKNLVISESSMMDDYEIGRILKYVSNHYATVTLSSAAKEFNFHPAYFSFRFKKLAECSFSEKLLQIRLQQAKRLLATSELPIHKIVEQVGFSEKSYFYKVFKKYYKMTPMEYRRQNRRQ